MARPTSMYVRYDDKINMTKQEEIVSYVTVFMRTVNVSRRKLGNEKHAYNINNV